VAFAREINPGNPPTAHLPGNTIDLAHGMTEREAKMWDLEANSSQTAFRPVPATTSENPADCNCIATQCAALQLHCSASIKHGLHEASK
jgi:hypothetical protein